MFLLSKSSGTGRPETLRAGRPIQGASGENLGYLLDSTIRSMLSFSSPTSGYLEAPRELIEFVEGFRCDIARASAELDRVLRTMLLALLAELVAPGKTTVMGRDLRKHGFDPDAAAPDPYDFI